NRSPSRSKPQLSSILASTKYWLMAVSSAVSTSLSSSMMSPSPRMAYLRAETLRLHADLTKRHAGSGREGGGHGPVPGIELLEQLPQRRGAPTAPAPGPASTGQFLGITRAGEDRPADGRVVDRAAVADQHGASPSPPRSARH